MVSFLSVAFSIQRVLQNAGAIVAAESFGPRDQAAVACDLVMLGGLGRVDQCRIEHQFVRDLAGDFIGFLG